MADRVGDGAARPLRRFGQNFLVDDRVARRLVDVFDPGPDDAVIEVGPGRGALTLPLAARAGRLVALELDLRLVPELEERLEPFPNAEVRHADALTVDWSGLEREMGRRLRVIGNLPFNVGTAIVRRLLATNAVLDVQIMLQLEVAERLLASPGTKSYGPLSVVAALRGRRERVAVLSPGVFRPRPKVRAAVVRLVASEAPALAAHEVGMLESWLFTGFGHRRKTLAGNLGAERDFVRAFLVEAGLPADARAEVVPPGSWLALARELARRRARPPSSSGEGGSA